MNEKSLYDTGFLFAVFDVADAYHEECSAAFDIERNVLLPEVVIPESSYLILRSLGYAKLIKFLRAAGAGEFTFVRTEPRDLSRAAEILEKYADAKVDFVDCVIVAIAERLNIERISTVDRRHFNLFRPAHCEFFEIVP